VPYFKGDASLFLLGILIICGNVLMPLWYINGLEKVVSSALAQMAVKGLALPFILIFINSPDDHYKYFLIYGLSTICIGIFTLFWMYVKLEVRFHIPKLELVFDSIREHFRLFASSIFLSFNTLIVIMCVKFFGGDAMLGYFNLVDRIRNAAIQVLHPISNALFPRMGYLFANDKHAARKLAISIGIIMIVSSSLLGLALYIFADKIIGILGGTEFDQSIALLKVLSISPLISTLFAFLVNQIAIPSGNDRIYFLATWVSVVLSALVVFPALVYFGLIGVGIITLIVDAFVLVFIGYFLKNKHVFRHNLFEKSN
jgi:O-antigen/teichoic acid export membrane protein